jgi:ABC-type transporter Mla maintaining outer membrane lipid asymmetry ATPase subunit MlaF
MNGASVEMSAADPSVLGRRLSSALHGALSCDLDGVSKLRYARAAVHFSIAGTREGVTLLLDRTPPVLAGNGEPGEISIELAPDLVEPFVRGSLSIHKALLSGGARVQGPVRRYLEVDPILRSRLAYAHVAARRVNGETGADSDLALSGSAYSRLVPSLPTDATERFAADQIAIEVRDLKKRFGDQEVLRGINLSIPEGVISVLLGPSGTGKSVLLKNIMGLMPHDAGDVIIRGRPMSQMNRSELLALRREIGLMFQDGALFSTMNLYDNVAFPLRQHTEMAEAEIRDVVMGHLGAVGLQDAVTKLPAELSGGMRKRAGLARAFALDPGIVLCDEPDSGLDPVRTALLAELLRAQHAKNGGTVLVITHNILLARQIGEHISVIWRGEIIDSGMAEVVLGSRDKFVQQFLAGDARGPLGME